MLLLVLVSLRLFSCFTHITHYRFSVSALLQAYNSPAQRCIRPPVTFPPAKYQPAGQRLCLRYTTRTFDRLLAQSLPPLCPLPLPARATGKQAIKRLLSHAIRPITAVQAQGVSRPSNARRQIYHARNHATLASAWPLSARPCRYLRGTFAFAFAFILVSSSR